MKKILAILCVWALQIANAQTLNGIPNQSILAPVPAGKFYVDPTCAANGNPACKSTIDAAVAAAVTAVLAATGAPRGAPVY